MPEEQNSIPTSSGNNQIQVKPVTFSKMVKDMVDTYAGQGVYSNAVNIVNNSHEGDLGTVSNEPANKYINKVPYTLIGAIPLTGEKWTLFSTDDENSEIGIYDDADESYRKLVNDPCLKFSRNRLITGASKKNADCSYSTYYADGQNPDRFINTDKIPYKEKPKTNTSTQTSCHVPEYTTDLDCESLRLSRLVQTPKLKLARSNTPGNLPNGTYQVVIGYAINSIRVSDYFLPSNTQTLFSHRNLSGSLSVSVEEIDSDFDEFELVLISTINQQVVAKRIGIYSTRQKTIVIDQVRESLVTVPIENIVLKTPAYDKSDAMFEVNDHLLRVGVYTKPDFNYQPIANKIKVNWAAVRVAADYYAKGGNLVSYMRDEVYAFFIRWIYNTGEVSADYPLIGREPDAKDLSLASGADVFEMILKMVDAPLKTWQVENTARITSTQSYPLTKGGSETVIMEGEMGYYESTERYPDNKPSVWADKCGKPILHHKIPDESLVPISSDDGRSINLIGVKFTNIQHPVDNDGLPIESIVGFQIMRASREGNKSIVAKGMLNNAGEYEINDLTGDTNASKDDILNNGSFNKVGLYPNFPFNSLGPNPYLSETEVKGGCKNKNFKPLQKFRKDIFTFHSPDTQFNNPYLSATELKIHGEIYGQVKGSFSQCHKHPKSKLLRDFGLIIAGMTGLGTGLLSIRGKKTTTSVSSRNHYTNHLKITGVDAGTITNNPAAVGIATATSTILKTLKDKIKTALETIPGSAATENEVNKLIDKLSNTADIPSQGNGYGPETQETTEDTAYKKLPLPVKILGNAHLFTYYFSQGTDEALRIIKAMIPAVQYAYQYNAHGFYNQFKPAVTGNKRRFVKDAVYLEPYLQDFAGKYQVNNLFRTRQVMLELNKELADPIIKDDSRLTIGELKQWDNPTAPFVRKTSAYYASLKVPQAAQYGQIESAIIVPVSTGVTKTKPVTNETYSSDIMFGGDVYINRYTEKNATPLFNEWMYDYPDNVEWDYRSHYNLPYPTYWMDSTKYEITNLTSSLIRLNFKENVLPNDLAHLDRKSSDCSSRVGFHINKGYFYLFVNGVRDFFVESEINTAFRDWDDKDEFRHYDSQSFTDLKTIFRSDIIKSGNHFKYDLSLSANKLFNNYFSWGSVLPKDFDPEVSEKCYTYYPKRAIYSNQQHEELKKDNWKVFLANNYKDFGSKITSIHSIDKSGAMIFFNDRSPVQFVGVDQLQTEAGIKLSIGDGGLFGNPGNPIVAADGYYEYGSCQSHRGIINTPAGLFYISQNQGKVFQYAGGLKNIGSDGLDFWLSEYLPSRLLQQFPNYELRDNPVSGVGCQLVYDNIYNVLYILKKDFKVKDEYNGQLVYVNTNKFLLNGRLTVQTGDPRYFDDCSWTLSYDIKTKGYVSFHTWIPDLVLPSAVHFITIKDKSLWKHNERTDLFCNFYGIDYPWEIEFPVSTGMDNGVLKSVEYQLECYRYLNDGKSKQHLLDENFDRMAVFNSEQHSGNLRLILKPKNNPLALLAGSGALVRDNDGIDIYFSKEENKYRVNQINDITRNRGEFIDNEQGMWITDPNGFQKEINPRYVDYFKNMLQQKKFRHYSTRVILKKLKSKNVKMFLRIFNVKQNQSFR